MSGVLHAASLAIHAIGRGLAAAKGVHPKHATKQIDRLLSNTGIPLARLFELWVQFVVGVRKELVVALDWTEFDADKQATICLYLVTSHGRATPLIWKSVEMATLEGRRNSYEDDVIERLSLAVPKDVQLTLLADRGFGDQKRYEHLKLPGWYYVIRFRECILVTDTVGTTHTASEWLNKTGRAKMLKGARVTDDKTEVPAVVLVHDKRMKDAWCLATSRADLGAAAVVKLYGRRFTIEETFRDTKDVHFGMGLSPPTSATLTAETGCSSWAPSPMPCSLCSAPPVNVVDSTARSRRTPPNVERYPSTGRARSGTTRFPPCQTTDSYS